MSQQIVVQPLGLITQPNQYGQYPDGALSLAENVVFRRPGCLEQAPGIGGGSFFGAANDQVHKQISLPGGITAAVLANVAQTAWGVFVNAGQCNTPSGISGGVGTFSGTGRISPVYVRSRVFLNALRGALVIDNPAVAVPMRHAGLPQPLNTNFGAVTLNGGPIPNAGAVTYAAVFRRDYPDGYTLVSKPSIAACRPNQTGLACGYSLRFAMITGCGVAAGDIIELYRSDTVLNALSNTDAGQTLKLVQTYTITAGDITAQFADVLDKTGASGLSGSLNVTSGRSLYSNPGLEGAGQVNRLPEPADCVELFKNFTFYGSITERPQFKISVAAGIGVEFTSGANAYFRDNGVGARTIAGTVTNGNATITGISAVDILGLAVGQVYGSGSGGASFPGGTSVTVVGGTSITMSAPATGSGTGITLFDVLEVAGVGLIYGSLLDLFTGGLGTRAVELTANQTILLNSFIPAESASLTVTVEPQRFSSFSSTGFTVRATNGQNFIPPLPSFPAAARVLSATKRTNILRWSKDSEPEHCPPENELFVGTGSILAMCATRNAMWIFCSDGLWRLSGEGGQWRVDQLSQTLIISAPQACCAFNESVYAYTNRGFVRIDDDGVAEISDGVVGNLLPGPEYLETVSVWCCTNEASNEVVIRAAPTILDQGGYYVYSTKYNAWSHITFFAGAIVATAASYARYSLSGTEAITFSFTNPGGQPGFGQPWNSGALLAPRIALQPLFAGSPAKVKQWISATYIFDDSMGPANRNVTPIWNGVDATAAAFTAIGLSAFAGYVGESRLTFLVPRRTPAIAPAIAPGFFMTSASPGMRLFGLVLRYKELAEQSMRRK